MAIVDYKSRVSERIWRSIAESNVPLSSIPQEQLKTLVDAIADGVIDVLREMSAEVGSDWDATAETADELTLWSGRPFLSLVERYTVTSERVRIRTGLLNKKSENVELVRIQDIDYRQGLGERIQSTAGGAELVAVLVVVTLEPSRAGAEDEPAARDVVEGAGHVGLKVGVAVAVAVDERSELDGGGELGPRPQLGPRLEVQPVFVSGEREEVVPVEEDVDAHVVERANGVANLGVEGVLRLHLDTQADGT